MRAAVGGNLDISSEMGENKPGAYGLYDKGGNLNDIY